MGCGDQLSQIKMKEGVRAKTGSEEVAFSLLARLTQGERWTVISRHIFTYSYPKSFGWQILVHF